jgi:short-subunit dehydrogenase
MAKTIIVAGYGPGISEGVARKFGNEGFQVALVARNKEKVESAAKSLRDAKIKAQAFTADLGDRAAVAKLIDDVRAALGPVTVLHWNAYVGGAGDLLTADVAELDKVLDVSLKGLIVATQKALPDLKAAGTAGALLVTGGGFALYGPQVDSAVVNWSAMGLAIAKAAQHKTVGLLHERLKAEGVYVGEVVVTGLVKNTPFDSGNANLEGSQVADQFWQLYQARGDGSIVFGG